MDCEPENECMQLAAKLIRVPSPNPPGDESAMAHAVEEHLRASGLSTQRMDLAPGRPSILGRIPGMRPELGAVVFCAHLDTVAAEEPNWTVEPFAATLREGRLYGRGASDMKTGLACLLLLARDLASQAPPQHDLIFAFTADEEGGYGGAASLRAAGLLDPARLLVITEPTAGKVYTGQKGELWIEVKFAGQAAHGSVPELGISALLPACRFATDILAAIRALPPEADGSRSSLNLGEIHSGWQVNVVPDSASIKLDVRVASPAHRLQVLTAVDSLGQRLADETGTRFTRNIFMDQNPIDSDKTSPLIRSFLLAAKEVYGDERPPSLCPYSTDAVAIVPELKIPVIIFGPGSIAQAHQPDEYIDLNAADQPLAVLKTFAAKL